MPKKYQVVLCGIARDEDRYIVEWVAYHLSIGFDHIYLYDNMSRRPIRDILSEKIQKKSVTVIRWPSIPGGNAQIDAYEHFLHTYGFEAEWGAVIDLDEFINLKQDDSMREFVRKFSQADCIAINWRIFGSSSQNNYRKSPLMERFVLASPITFQGNILTKSIYRLSSVEAIHHHSGVYKSDERIYAPDGRIIPNGPHSPIEASAFAIAQINHYFVKSREEWDQKNIRGYSDGTVRNYETFKVHDLNDELEISIQRRRKKFDRLIYKVSSKRLFVPKPYSWIDHTVRYFNRKLSVLYKYIIINK